MELEQSRAWGEESPEKEVIILRYEANCDVRHAERGEKEQPGSPSPLSSLLPSPLLPSVTESWGVICFTHFDARPAA